MADHTGRTVQAGLFGANGAHIVDIDVPPTTDGGWPDVIVYLDVIFVQDDARDDVYHEAPYVYRPIQARPA